MVMSKEELEAFEAQRDIAAELLQAAEEIRDNRPSAVMVPTEDGQYVRSEVARVRSVLKLSQSKFARLLGVPVATVQAWEQGRREPGAAALSLLKVAEKRPDVLQAYVAVAA